MASIVESPPAQSLNQPSALDETTFGDTENENPFDIDVSTSGEATSEVSIEVNRKTISQIELVVKNVSQARSPNWTYSQGFCNDKSIFLFGFCLAEDAYVLCIQFVSLRPNQRSTPVTRVRFYVKSAQEPRKPFVVEGLCRFEKLNEYFSGRIPKDHMKLFLEEDILKITLDFVSSSESTLLPEPLTELKSGHDEIFWFKVNDFANLPVNGSRLSEVYKIRDESFELYVARTAKMFMLALYCNRRGRSSSFLSRFGHCNRDTSVHCLVKVAIVSPDNNPRIPAEALTTFSHQKNRLMWIFEYNRVKDLLPTDKTFLWIMLKVSLLSCYPVKLMEMTKERKKLDSQLRSANIKIQEQQTLIRELSELTLSTESETDHSDLCIICMTRRVDTMIEPCHHVVLCCVDAARLKSLFSDSSPGQCPSCRGPVQDMVKIFLP